MINSGVHIVRKLLADGTPRWHVYAYRGGPRIHTADGPRPIIGPEILDAAHEARLGERRPTEGTLAAVIADYKADDAYTRLADSTRHDYARCLDRISDTFGHGRLAAFNDPRMRAEIIAWRDTAKGTPRAADMNVSVFSTLLKWAHDRGLVRVNIAAGIPTIARSNRSDVIWTPEIWRAVAEHAPPHLMQALRLGALTGLRQGDLIELQWANVGRKSIVVETRKRKARAVVPLLDELSALLDEIAGGGTREGHILLNSRKKPWTSDGLRAVWQKVRTKAGVQNVHFHDLRGTYVTWLATKRLTNEEIARIIGWSVEHVSQIRNRYVDEAKVIVSIVDRLQA